MSTDKTTATPTTTAITNKVTSLVNREDSYPWSKDVRRVLSQVFKLQDFRPNQLEAINTTLKGEDAFVLMPTGGGKSLCYQLPAIISGQYFNRSSSSVTIVVSPLLSLMHDQVAQLTERGITAGLLNGVITPEQRAAVFKGLSSNPPQFSLIYVTPEMIRQSGLFQNTVQKLYNLKQLARFVIDEAHCVSQWGHDFRPDYKMLGELKIQYKDIPIIALTATANQRVQSDIINSLHISNCKIFKQSFNRPNLKYEIVKGITKYNQRIDDISDFIKRRFRNQCGIVYCQTRKQCEDVAKRLYETHNIKTDYYHAARESEERIALQEKWQRGEYKVLVATIAFGMGIDKADVRFVIHFALPSSVEGYYQETGRAGRDGLDATCRLYYSFNDSKTHTMIIDKGEGDYRVKEFQRNNLRVMVQYCDNEMDCRRKQILGYFGEVFDTRLCQGSTMCDNCRKNQGKNMVEQDYTSMALGILHILKYLLDIDEKVTLIQLGDIFRGYGPKRLQGKGVENCPGFINNKDGTKLNKNETQRLTNHMVVCGILELRNEVNMGGYTSSYV
ncbi:P-loop containing nucleoside triphosphate hydrolase protein, partial [Cunninghamella echinulata]